ncbi:hypothetical protein GCK32_009231 [Trichostrongylus colubriformis]|uniref:VWFA domain-containing protein n=1 Tax=Trichostrongylus colubriformis TaxID=6319 RepID=A0AAN8FCB7_TRICO
MGSKMCIMCFLIVLLFLPSQCNLGEDESDETRLRHRRDDESKYYDPSTRLGCPPSMSAGLPPQKDRAVMLIVDATKATIDNRKNWELQINFLEKAISYVQGVRIGLVVMQCSSEESLPLELHTEAEFEKVLSDQHPNGMFPKKGIDAAFNSVYQVFVVS